MPNIKIYMLTHKKFDYKQSDLYEPLLNGSALLDEDFGYTRDDTGDNISELNPYYSELTGEYWAWKNSDADIIGFCHYRRYFVNLPSRKRLEKKDIEKILKDYDIIMPQKRHFSMTNIEEIKAGHDEANICQTVEDYELLRKIIEEKTPEYLESFDAVLNEKESYWFNSYISKKEILDDYFEWLFKILEEFRKQTDFSKYEDGNMRVLGYLSERLINVYIKKNNLRVKEKFFYQTQLVLPMLNWVGNRYPFFQNLFKRLAEFEKIGAMIEK